MVGRDPGEVVSGRTLTSLFSVAGRIFLDTHLLPMLRTPAIVREIDLHPLRPDGVGPRAGQRQSHSPHRADLHCVLCSLRPGSATGLGLTTPGDGGQPRALASLGAALAETLHRRARPAPDTAPRHRRGVPTGRQRPRGWVALLRSVQVSASAWLVVVGDVSGKGISARHRDPLVRYTVRCSPSSTPTPPDLLHQVDAVLRASDTERYCTVVVARLERRRRDMGTRPSLGGHPPALLRAPDGTVTELGTRAPRSGSSPSRPSTPPATPQPAP